MGCSGGSKVAYYIPKGSLFKELKWNSNSSLCDTIKRNISLDNSMKSRTYVADLFIK